MHTLNGDPYGQKIELHYMIMGKNRWTIQEFVNKNKSVDLQFGI